MFRTLLPESRLFLVNAFGFDKKKALIWPSKAFPWVNDIYILHKLTVFVSVILLTFVRAWHYCFVFCWKLEMSVWPKQQPFILSSYKLFAMPTKRKSFFLLNNKKKIIQTSKYLLYSNCCKQHHIETSYLTVFKKKKHRTWPNERGSSEKNQRLSAILSFSFLIVGGLFLSSGFDQWPLWFIIKLPPNYLFASFAFS